MKVVLDTNVLISAFISLRSPPAQVVNLFQHDDYTLLLSDAVFTELRRVFDYPHLCTRYAYSDEQVTDFLRGLQNIAVWIAPTEQLSVVPEDETDNRFIELAIAGSARYIVTGYKHLLKLRRYQSIEIVSPAEFLALIQVEQPD